MRSRTDDTAGTGHNVEVNTLGIPRAVFRCATEVVEQFRSRTDVSLDVGQVLTGRAHLLGTAPAGHISAGGATHLLRTLDGWCAITLARKDDVAAVPAMIEADHALDDSWPIVHEWASARCTASVVERARLLDIPAAALFETVAAPPRVLSLGAAGAPRRAAGLLVADLTSMWAGPLCGQVLARAGAIVVKVESPSRPDGTRVGNPTFFDWMNGGKLSYSIDFDRDFDRLRALLTAADVVLEGSRPAALSRRGLGPTDVGGPTGRVWLRISGYGTLGENAHRAAFGDDAAVAGGLVGWSDGEPTFCGDAIADPLTGLSAALAVVDALDAGGGQLIEISMAEVAASYAAMPTIADQDRDQPMPPIARTPASPLGADDDAVARLLKNRTGKAC